MKILYVTTISNTVNAFLIPHIKMLIDEGHQVNLAFNIEQDIKQEIQEMGCKVYEVPFRRSPLSLDTYRAYKKLKKLIQSEKYELIHTHTPVASALVRLACRDIKSVKVFYTAHGFHFYNGAPLRNWLLFYPIEYYLAKHTDVLITINEEDYQRAARRFKSCKVQYIPGVGIDLEKFSSIQIDKKVKRRELGLPENAFVILSVGELNKNKNHEVILESLAKINNLKMHYIICGEGPLENHLIKLANSLGIIKQVHLLGQRKDIPEILATADLFAFPSYREGLPVSLMEAMATGLPVVVSDCRGNRDMVKHGKNGLVVAPDDIEHFVDAIKRLYESDMMRNEFGGINREIAEKVSINLVKEKIIIVYNQILIETSKSF